MWWWFAVWETPNSLCIVQLLVLWDSNSYVTSFMNVCRHLMVCKYTLAVSPTSFDLRASSWDFSADVTECTKCMRKMTP